ncbi:zinc finger and SCAN domain-containing protein 2-like [Etheostoma cragini]|uniref:zinc finger and SCAN domain-containing protein 2-like n=1 Tax=Etheostoma cragini TaxID=417921 RepID=UPI00155EC1CD|nr:zinc finger and SCAN domain-containing protein 2-like [Etheostoma cragini]
MGGPLRNKTNNGCVIGGLLDVADPLSCVVVPPELPQQHVCKEEEVLSDQHLWIQERNSSLDQEDPEPPQIKEDQEDLCTSPEGEQLVLKMETETFMLTPTSEERDHSEGQTLNFSPDGDPLRAAEKESIVHMPVLTSVVSAANRDHQLLSHTSHEAESPDQKGGQHGDSGPARNAEPEPKKRQRKTRSLSNNVDNTNTSETHPDTQTELPQQHVCNSHEAESPDQKGGQHGDSGPARNAEPEPKKRRRKTRRLSNNVDNTNTSETHPDTQTGKQSFRCPTCGKDFTRNSTLKTHLRTHTGEKPYSCQTCGKNFSRRFSLSAHVRSHTGEKLFSCKTCGKDLISNSALIQHMRIHTGDKPFACKTCGKRHHQGSALIRHMRTHTGEKPYPGKTCGKGFRRKDVFNVHVRIHTGEKPYGCKTCSKRYHDDSALQRHMRTHTGDKPYSCKTCGKGFRRKDVFNVHMRIHTDPVRNQLWMFVIKF